MQTEHGVGQRRMTASPGRAAPPGDATGGGTGEPLDDQTHWLAWNAPGPTAAPAWLVGILRARPTSGWIALNLLVAAAYCGLGLPVAQFFASHGLFPAPIWLPASLALVAAMISPLRMLPGLFLASFIVNHLLFAPPVGTSLLISAGNALGPALGAFATMRLARSVEPFGSFRGLLAFLACGIGLHAAVTATTGTVALALQMPLPVEALLSVWTRWWLSDSGGTLYLAPALLLWLRARRGWPTRGALLEAAAVSLGTLCTALVLFAPVPGRQMLLAQLPYLLVLPLSWLTLRLSLRSAYTLFSLVAIIATAGTVMGLGPFNLPGIDRPLTALGGMVVLFSINILVLAAVVRERRKATEESLAKSTFLSVMSHELRTPLNAIIGFSDVLRQEFYGPIGDRRYRDYAAEIHRSGTSLQALLSDIVDLAGIESGRFHYTPEPVALAPAIGAAIDTARVAAEASAVTVEARVEDGLPTVQTDPRALRRVLLNLLANGMQRSRAGGTVRLTAWQEGRRVLVALEDSGPPLNPEDMDLALLPFAQRDSHHARHHPGAGLELPLARALAEAQGARLRLKRGHGGRTRVLLDLPAGAVPADAAPQPVS